MTEKSIHAGPENFLPLTVPVFHILLALTDEERHGYAILQEIEARTEGSLRLGTGTLYTALGRMVRSGLVEESDSRPAPELDDDRRRYYRLTALGRQVVRAEAIRLDALVEMARQKQIISAAPARGGGSRS